MKKVLILIICLMFIPVVYAKENVEIVSIELDKKVDNTVIKNEPTYEGLDMNYDLAFKKVGDYARYKITVKNNTDDNYVIKDSESFGEHKFIKYIYEGKGELKANSTTDLYVTISYNSEVEPGNYVMGKYNESNKVVVELLKQEKENPNTKTGIILFAVAIFALIVFVVSMILFKNKAIKYTSVILLIGVIIIPLAVKALDRIVININVNVEIEQTYKVVYNYRIEGLYTMEQIEQNQWQDSCWIGDNDNIWRFDDDGPNYYGCRLGFTYEDPVKRYVGEQVFLDVHQEIQECSSNSYYPKDGYYLCTGELVTFDKFDPNNGASWYNGITYFDYFNDEHARDNDPLVMNFIGHGYEVYDLWNEKNHLISVPTGAEFTMPDHDVYFEETIRS